VAIDRVFAEVAPRIDAAGWTAPFVAGVVEYGCLVNHRAGFVKGHGWVPSGRGWSNR
jgi:hypothetical protein